LFDLYDLRMSITALISGWRSASEDASAVWPQPEAREQSLSRAEQLVMGSLIPVDAQSSYYGRMSGLHFKSPARIQHHSFVPDQGALVLVLNDLFLRQPERFGDETNRARLQAAMVEASSKYARNELLGKIADILTEHAPDALKGIKIALAGFDDPETIKQYEDDRRYAAFGMGGGGPVPPENLAQWRALSDGGDRILALFGAGNVLDVNPRRTGIYLTLKDVHRRDDKGTYDYVVTSNVINDPDTDLSGNFPFIAAASLSKEGGHIFHLVSYSPDFYDQTFDHPYLSQLIGQQIIARQPMPPQRNELDGHFTFIGLEQVAPCRISPDFIDILQCQGVVKLLPFVTEVSVREPYTARDGKLRMRRLCDVPVIRPRLAFDPAHADPVKLSNAASKHQF
jgi:hypothetical protein